mmetsp:Transcript_31573/g.48342  ORF Transcript_31573/g.48342 Transcript_31573/m.48342 type:complete len:243 (-) Transcript_31573:65-793(-)
MITKSERSASVVVEKSARRSILAKWDKVVRLTSMSEEAVPELRATMHGEDNFSIRRQTDSKATEVTTARKGRNEPAATAGDGGGADRPIRRSSLSGPLPSIAAVDEEVYNIFEFRDFKDRMRASKRVTAMSIHQAIHADGDPRPAKAEAEAAPQRRGGRRTSLQGLVMKRMLSSMNSVSFAEESATPAPPPPPTNNPFFSSSTSLSSSSSSSLAYQSEEGNTNILKSRYMRNLSMNLHQESC